MTFNCILCNFECLAFARGPVGPTRQPLPVARNQAEDASGSPPSILPPQLPKQETEKLPEGAPGHPDDVWSPWLGVCQNFVSTQPCKNGQVSFFSRINLLHRLL